MDGLRTHREADVSEDRRVRWFLVLLPALLCGFLPSLLHAQQPAVSSLQQVTAALDSAKSQQAEVLSPKAYTKALAEYRRLVELVRQGRPDTELKPVIQQFRQALDTAMKNVTQGTVVLKEALAASSRAMKAQAPEVAAKEFQSAQVSFSEAVTKLEGNNLKAAEKLGKEAAAKYNQAEASAVRISLLGTARALAAEAKTRKADEYAPRTYGRVQTLIREIEAAMAKGEASTEDLRMKAALAEDEARHAIYLASVLDTLRRNPTNWERTLLEQEQIVSRIAESMGLRPTFEYGVQAPIDSLISVMQQRQETLARQVALRDNDVVRLSREVDSLRTAFDQYQIRLAAMIEQYQTDLQARKEELEFKRRELDVELRKKMQLEAIDQAQNTFLKHEALVFRDGTSLVIRLIGLNFPSGVTVLQREAFPLLDKVGTVLTLFPKSKVAVAGHTAATGDEKINLTQSEARAKAVRDYLVSKAGGPATRITARGFGGTKPIAENLTPQGRAQNRRIDIMIELGE